MFTQKRRTTGFFGRHGQSTGFVILGIVILAVLFLAVYLRERVWFGPVTPDTLGEKAVPIKDHLLSCLSDVASEKIRTIGLQGGYLSEPEGTFRLAEGIPVSYLCYNIPGEPTCMNRALTLGQMEQELEDSISKGLLTCIEFNTFKKRGFDFSVGSQSVDVQIGRSAVEVTLHQPITLRKKDAVVKEDTFSRTFAVPLGRLYDVSQDIVAAEATQGAFDQLLYMLAHKGEYVIDKKKPYPDILYVAQAKDSDYIFQFMIQGEPLS